MSVLDGILGNKSATSPSFLRPLSYTQSGFSKSGTADLNEMEANADDPRMAAMGAARLGPAATMGPTTIDRTGDETGRSFEGALAGMYASRAAGGGPSLADMQMRSGLDTNTAATYAAAMNGKGTASPLAARAAMTGGAATGLGIAGQGAMGRMGEVASAGNGLIGTLGAMRGVDDAAATAQAGLDARTASANADFANKYKLAQAGFDQDARSRTLQAILAQRSGNDAMTKFALAGKAGLAEGDITGQTNYWRALNGSQLDWNALNAQKDAYNRNMALAGAAAAGSGFAAASSGMGGPGGPGDTSAGVAQGFGNGEGGDQWTTKDASGEGGYDGGMTGGTEFSDEDLKVEIKAADEKLTGFLDALRAHSYRYKDPAFGGGRYVSPMAQELEKTEIGKDMVIDTPVGKMVDYGRAAGTQLAASAMLNKRLSRVEKEVRAVARETDK